MGGGRPAGSSPHGHPRRVGRRSRPAGRGVRGRAAGGLSPPSGPAGACPELSASDGAELLHGRALLTAPRDGLRGRRLLPRLLGLLGDHLLGAGTQPADQRLRELEGKHVAHRQRGVATAAPRIIQRYPSTPMNRMTSGSGPFVMSPTTSRPHGPSSNVTCAPSFRSDSATSVMTSRHSFPVFGAAYAVTL